VPDLTRTDTLLGSSCPLKHQAVAVSQKLDAFRERKVITETRAVGRCSPGGSTLRLRKPKQGAKGIGRLRQWAKGRVVISDFDIRIAQLANNKRLAKTRRWLELLEVSVGG
jgi:hypothetical protein